MSDGPYNQSIRGEEPGGLRWLFLQIASLLGGLAALPDLLTAVQQIRDDLRRISGNPETTPEFWQGIPRAFLSESEAEEFNIVQLNRQISNQLSTLTNLNIATSNATVSMRQMMGFPQPGFSTFPETLVGLLEGNRDNTAFILEAIGPRGGSIDNLSARALLAEIVSNTLRSAECCEEQNSTPNPNPDNNAPVNFGCPNAVRVSRWTNVGVENSTTPAQNIWQPHWDDPPPGIALNTFESGARTSYNLFTGVSKYDLCLSWNFNNNEAQPTNIGVDIAPDPQVVATSNFFGGSLPGSSSFVIGGWIIELSSCVPNDPGNDAVKWLFRFPQGMTPGLNAFLASVQRNCAQ